MKGEWDSTNHGKEKILGNTGVGLATGAHWLQKCLHLYAEKICRERMIGLSSIQLDEWVMIYLKTVWKFILN